MSTSTLPYASTRTRPRVNLNTAAMAAYAVGAVGLLGEAVIHVQQFISVFSTVRWIGPLFIINAASIVVVLAGLAYARTRPLAALAGITLSALALLSLAISYGTGLFGFQEAGLRTATAIAIVAEVVAIVFLAAGLTARSIARR